MAKVGWLILGLLVLWAHPSHASMALCPDNTHWYPTSEGVSYCPDTFTISSAAPTTTTVVLSGTVTEATGTVHTAIRLTCDLLQWRNTTKGTLAGAEADADDTDVSSGAWTVTVTGLAEGTTYCAHILQYTNDRASVQKTVAFTTLTSSPPAEDIGAEITGGDDYFFCPDGSDANSGLTHALRKQNYPTTDTTILGAGDDMWLCTGGVWTNRHHDIARQGASGDINEVGTYYMDSSTPRKAVDGVPGPETTHTKAAIRGALTDACISAGTCTFPSTFPTNGYTSIYDGLVVIASTADYTTIQNIEVSYGQYNSITASGTGSTASLTNLIFDGVDIHYNGRGARITLVDGVTDFVVRNGDGYMQNVCNMIKGIGTSSNTTGCTNPWSGTFVTVTRNSGRGLVEWNTTRRGMGEGYNCYNTSLGKMIYRNNKSVNVWSDSIYLDGCPDSVVESNITLGGNGHMLLSKYNNGASFTGIHIGSENTAYPNAVGNVVRNNLFVGSGRGIEGNMFSASSAAGEKIGAKIYGNTTIAATNLSGTGLEYEVRLEEPAANLTEWDNQNNVHWNTSLGAAMCLATSGYSGADNHWSTNPSDADCDGSGDTYGDPTLTLSSFASWQALANVNGDHPVTWPTWANANPSGGSPVIGTGTALTSSILDKDTYGVAYTQITEVVAGTLTEAEWEGALIVDAEGTTRANPPSKGAVE